MMIDSHENEDKEHHQDWEGEKAINGHWPLSYIRIRRKKKEEETKRRSAPAADFPRLHPSIKKPDSAGRKV